MLAVPLTKPRDFASTRHRLISLSLVRICFGTIVLTYYARHVAQRAFLWGSDGVVPFQAFYLTMRAQHNFSLYMLSSSPTYQAAIFYVGFLVTIGFTLGYRTPISSVLFYVFTRSLFQRNF